MIKVGIVGCGRISDLHLLGYEGRTDARVTAVCDANAKRARQKAKEWGGTAVFKNYDHFLAEADVDLVELLVPHHLHAPMTIAACRAGKHVSVQKPMALTIAECDQMMAAARENGVTLRVYENFVFYPPCVRAKAMLDAGEIGEPQMLRIHMNTGKQSAGWDVPLRAWLWRFDEKKAGGGPIVFDHGYHLFSLARWLMGEVAEVSAWIDRSPVIPTKSVDAPAVVMCRFKGKRRYGVMDFAHTPGMVIDSDFYADDNRVEIVGEKGIIFINRCTAKTVDLPPLMLFRDGKTTAVLIERDQWQHSFIDCTRHLLEALQNGGRPSLDGETGKAVLQFVLAAYQSAQTGQTAVPGKIR